LSLLDSLLGFLESLLTGNESCDLLLGSLVESLNDSLGLVEGLNVGLILRGIVGWLDRVSVLGVLFLLRNSSLSLGLGLISDSKLLLLGRLFLGDHSAIEGLHNNVSANLLLRSGVGLSGSVVKLFGHLLDLRVNSWYFTTIDDILGLLVFEFGCLEGRRVSGSFLGWGCVKGGEGDILRGHFI
jgi:hypothetical protein